MGDIVTTTPSGTPWTKKVTSGAAAVLAATITRKLAVPPTATVWVGVETTRSKSAGPVVVGAAVVGTWVVVAGAVVIGRVAAGGSVVVAGAAVVLERANVPDPAVPALAAFVADPPAGAPAPTGPRRILAVAGPVLGVVVGALAAALRVVGVFLAVFAAVVVAGRVVGIAGRPPIGGGVVVGAEAATSEPLPIPKPARSVNTTTTTADSGPRDDRAPRCVLRSCRNEGSPLTRRTSGLVSAGEPGSARTGWQGPSYVYK